MAAKFTTSYPMALIGIGTMVAGKLLLQAPLESGTRLSP